MPIILCVMRVMGATPKVAVMDLQLLKTFLLWNLSINYLIIILWFAAFVFAHDGMYRLHNRWFPLSV